MKILVIENDERYGKLLSQMIDEHFKKDGYQTVTLTDAQEGIDLVKKEYVSLVITDMRMPGLDGFDVIREVKNIDTNIPIIMITAFPSIDDTIEALKMGAHNYISKTSGSDEIVKAIGSSLESIETSREHADEFNSVAIRSFTVSFPTKKEYCRDVMHQVICLTNTSGYSRVAWSIHLALEEAVMNAIEHGNKRDISKNIIIRCTINPQDLEIIIEDEGAGFEHRAIKVADETAESGRGLMLMRSFMDKVEFNDKGNSIKLIKYKPSNEEREVENVL